MAAAVLTAQLTAAGLGGQVEVVSAGIGGWHVGQGADDRAVAVLREHGYDASAHEAQQFTASWFAQFDVVLAVDRDVFADLMRIAPDQESRPKIQLLRAYDADSLARGDLDVPDPYYGDRADFAHALALIENAATGLVETISTEVDPEAEPDDGGGPSRH